MLIEKPLASSVREGSRIVSLARRYDTVVAVGHSRRCNPVVQAMKRFCADPKFIEAHRVSPYPFRSTDVSVVLDVMIHDIDIVLSLAHSKIRRVEAVGVNVIGDTEDMCDARIAFENGCVAHLSASRVALQTERRLRLFTRQAYLSVDYAQKSGIVIRADANQNVVEWIRASSSAVTSIPPVSIGPSWYTLSRSKSATKSPFAWSRKPSCGLSQDRSCRPEVSGDEGLAALRCADQILRAVERHKRD